LSVRRGEAAWGGMLRWRREGWTHGLLLAAPLTTRDLLCKEELQAW